MARPIVNRHPRRHATQGGFTLVELLVAVLLSLIVVLASVSGLIVARRGFSTVDAAGQLRDSGRFAVDIIQKIAGQSGYLDAQNAIVTQSTALNIAGVATPAPFIEGYNNALVSPINHTGVSSITAPYASNGNRDSSCGSSTDTACANGSDVLVLRYQASETFSGSGKTDGTMIDCNGVSQTTPPTSRTDLVVNIFQVLRGLDGEPTLVCTSNANRIDGTFLTQPLVQGVESFQVLYGVDGVTPNTAPTATNIQDSVPDQYLRADQLVVAGNASATQDNFRRVRALRIGMVLRGPANSAQESATIPLSPLGIYYANASADKGSVFAAQTDGRLRQAVTFTVYLHNYQGT